MLYHKREEVVLVNPRLNSINSNSSFNCYRFKCNEFTANFPLGLIYLASYLLSNGHKVRIIDAEKVSKSESFKEVQDSLPNALVIGITVMTPALPYALELSEFVKHNAKTVPVVWGGIHPTLFPDETVKDDFIDFIVVGEGEVPFNNLITCLKSCNYKGIQEIPNLMAKNKTISRLREMFYDLEKPLKGYTRSSANGKLDKYSLQKNDMSIIQAYQLLDFENYINVLHADGTVQKTLEIISSRGCPYHCSFCINSILNRGSWKPEPVDKLIQNINVLVNKYSITHLFFMDELFFFRINRAVEIIKGINELNITWEANIRADFLRKEFISDGLLRFFKQAGCKTLRIGAESGSLRILKLLKKNISPRDILDALERCTHFGILCNFSFMIAIPGETKEDMRKTMNLIEKVLEIEPKTEIIGPQPFRPYPGSFLFNKLVDQKVVEIPNSPQAWLKSPLLANLSYLNIVTGKFDKDTVNYLYELGYTLGYDINNLKRKNLCEIDRAGRRFQKLKNREHLY